MGMHVPCHTCGAPEGHPCVNLKTGRPLKGEHRYDPEHGKGRYLMIQGGTLADLFAQVREELVSHDPSDTLTPMITTDTINEDFERVNGALIKLSTTLTKLSVEQGVKTDDIVKDLQAMRQDLPVLRERALNPEEVTSTSGWEVEILPPPTGPAWYYITPEEGGASDMEAMWLAEDAAAEEVDLDAIDRYIEEDIHRGDR